MARNNVKVNTQDMVTLLSLRDRVTELQQKFGIADRAALTELKSAVYLTTEGKEPRDWLVTDFELTQARLTVVDGNIVKAAAGFTALWTELNPGTLTVRSGGRIARESISDTQISRMITMPGAKALSEAITKMLG